MSHEMHLLGNNEFIERNQVKFLPEQRVYIVKQKRKKTLIIEDKIDYISFTKNIGDISSYNLYIRYHTYASREVYWNDSNNIFDNKENAYKYAEQLDRRRNIKFKKNVLRYFNAVGR